MPTLADLTVAEELIELREIGAARGWVFSAVDHLRFLIGLPARDQSMFYLLVSCDNYPVQPPAWHWCNTDASRMDQASDKPGGSGFLHPRGVICAPWNRLAYRSVDPRGPHEDWTIGDWKNNPQSVGYTTLAHMALRVYVELNSPRYTGKRLG